MKSLLTRITDDFLHSFNGSAKGASAKKYTAFVIVCCIVGLHIEYWLNFDIHYLIEIIITDMTFVATLFGIGTFEKTKSVAPDSTPKSTADEK